MMKPFYSPCHINNDTGYISKEPIQNTPDFSNVQWMTIIWLQGLLNSVVCFTNDPNIAKLIGLPFLCKWLIPKSNYIILWQQYNFNKNIIQNWLLPDIIDKVGH